MPALVVEGLHELQTGFAQQERDVKLAFRGGLRQVAEPVQRGAEELAQGYISHIGPRWSKMRIGITRDLVYVAPRSRGRGNRNRARPNLANLLMNRAMEPALEQHASEIEARFGEILDHVV